MKIFQVLSIGLLFFVFSSLANAQNTPVACNGQLKIEGAHLKNQHGKVLQLKGMSLFWSQWEPEFYVPETIKILKNDWKCNVVRAAMAVENKGYLENSEQELKKVEVVIDAAIKEGVYVIVDWHDHHAEDHLKEAKRFFTYIAKKYGDRPNIIYEIYNEPLEVSWDDVLKPYHQEIIKTIRAYDSHNVIICGTPSWSQRVDVASVNPIQQSNIAYTLHFYADTHRQPLRDIAIKAMNNDLPIFVTEYGTAAASCNGVVNKKQTKAWWQLLDEYKISYCNWAISDKDETCSVLNPGSSVVDLKNSKKLSVSGKFIRSKLKSSFKHCE
ncbi:glycoside hydrolase family 5 protein [Mesonia aestuariivivens]|uniref:Glycoside hydrolase family 5 protein n=1 Tax=Mesonia aestuariivivens TaxID=2796128 RepID=A0ABS6W4D8_9FLAO|nr:glycoside hydrolase family 5 protein [Mesonia aestuariivivens]MBW2962731.1 glycoside hydrolase family 5 protein [Mesonia aestuariivivens]